ncbi:uncharacterized protein LOC6600939 isoform X2 [Drosophila persimilis]|uniref:uncharacterized protein LOC6600939 isoform X2 n=1 Tax=Drosophila persimilis TaxID=7234 RepID=UPI000F08C4CB|nr:uncharacterized protein LOC6600939 isoform X2 [Drosophila persimilis]
MLLLCLLLLHEAPLAHPYKEHLQSTFTNVSVEYSPEFCGSIRGWLTPQGNLNLDIHLNRTLRQGLRTAITLQQRVGGGYQTLFSYDLDTCRTLGELLQSSLMKVWLRNVFRPTTICATSSWRTTAFLAICGPASFA